MSRSEKFNFILALVGLSADTIGIGTFLFALGQANAIATSKESTTLLVLLFGLSGSILIYGWFGIAWFFVRRSYKVKMKYRPDNIIPFLMEICIRASVLGGILALPGIVMWFCLLTDPAVLIIAPIPIFVIGGVISWSIYYLMPMIYENMMHFMEDNAFSRIE